MNSLVRPPLHRLIYLCQIRYAGHSKWQNIKSTKGANDLNKSKLYSRYVNMVRRAVVSNNLQTDPKLNKALADVLNEATKLNIPKATMDRAIQRSANIKLEQKLLEVVGPGGSVILLRCETDNYGLLRRECKKKMKKSPSSQLANENTLLQLFSEKGFVRTTNTTKDGKTIDIEFAEEAAINSNAEEVIPSQEDETWIFAVEPERINHCRVDLEKQNLNVVACYTELVPHRRIELSDDHFDETLELIELLQEIPEILEVFHNVIRKE